MIKNILIMAGSSTAALLKSLDLLSLERISDKDWLKRAKPKTNPKKKSKKKVKKNRKKKIA